MGVNVQMFAVLPSEPTEQQIIRWSYELAVCFPGDVWHSQEEVRALVLVTDHDIETDRPVLEVSTLMRYYGIQYERGPLPTIIMIAEWLERKLNAQVYYCGDSYPYPLPFNRDERNRLFNHYVDTVGTAPYHSRWNAKQAPICSFDNEPMWCQSAGPYERYVFSCPACNQEQTIDNNPIEIQKTYESWINNKESA